MAVRRSGEAKPRPSRAARPKAGATPEPLPAPPRLEVIQVRTHRQLASAFREVARRVAKHPRYGIMFAINPVLALERYGVKLTPALRDHVLRTLKNPGSAGTRRHALEASLTQAFGEAPRPENPAWLANALFKVLKLTPLDSRGYEPAYAPPLNAAILARLEPLRPKPRRKYLPLRPGAVKSSVGLTPWREKARLLDLAAPAPDLPRARQAPRALGLEEAWFYKDRDPVAHDLVELGAIQRTGFFFHSPDSFRRIAAGEASNVFRTWIREVRFKDARR